MSRGLPAAAFLNQGFHGSHYFTEPAPANTHTLTGRCSYCGGVYSESTLDSARHCARCARQLALVHPTPEPGSAA